MSPVSTSNPAVSISLSRGRWVGQNLTRGHLVVARPVRFRRAGSISLHRSERCAHGLTSLTLAVIAPPRSAWGPDNCSPSTRSPLGAESVHTCVCTNAKELRAAPSLQRRIRMRTPGASCLTIWGQVSSIAFHAINETLPIVSTNVRTQTSTKYRSGRAPSELGRSHEPGVNIESSCINIAVKGTVGGSKSHERSSRGGSSRALQASRLH